MGSEEFPPIIQLISPEEGDILSGKVTIRWYAIDDDLLGEDLPIYIYYSNDNIHWMRVGDVHCNNIDLEHGSYEWDTSSIASGTYTLLVEAYSGLVGFKTIQVTISGGSPGIQIDTTIEDISIDSTEFVRNGDTIQIKAAITGTQAKGLSRSEISADLTGFNRGIVIADSFNGFIASWTLYNVQCTPADGTISVIVHAGDLFSSSASIQSDNTDPMLSIVTPVNGFYFFNSRIPLRNRTIIFGSITIEVDATDNFKINSVEFYVDGKLEKTISEQPIEWYTNLPRGNHHLEVIVYDGAGNTASDTLNFNKFI
jgi:hypothetical protein